MHKPVLEQQLEVHTSVPNKHTEDSHMIQRTRYNMGQIFPTYAQEYAEVTNVPGYIMSMNMIISRRTKIYVNAEVSDPDAMYFHQAMK